MRANLQTDPERGAGYGLLEIHDAAEVLEPALILKRLSDNQTLGKGGWASGENSLALVSWDNDGRILRVWLDSRVIDNLDPGDHYSLSIPGVGSCALDVTHALRSLIIDENGAEAWPPPPQRPATPPAEPAPVEIVYQGVEPTPADMPEDADADLPDSVTAVSPDAIIDPPPRKRGCLWICLALVIIWACVGWYLWHAASNLPPRQNEPEESKLFEIIPKSDEGAPLDEETDKPEILDKK